MDVAELDYTLPAAAIAQHPAEPRDAARLLVDTGPGRAPEDRSISSLPGLLGQGDVVVVNDSRVFNARLAARKPTGGSVEVLLVEPLDGLDWAALIRPSRRVRLGTRLSVDGPFDIVVGAGLEDSRMRRVTLDFGEDVDIPSGRLYEVLAQVASLALPPYITEPLNEPTRYQTIYANHPGSVAAPTAGLHVTDELIGEIEAAGATFLRVDLSVGPGTFLPVTSDSLDDHVMHEERYLVGAEVLRACADADRVVAIGTTTVRALESAARGDESGRTDLFIRPGFDFRVVDALLTNFHQPRSTLLALLAAFVGPRWRELYSHALDSGYRFLSFGDAMFVPSRTAG